MERHGSSRTPARAATSRESAATSCSRRHGSHSRSRCQCTDSPVKAETLASFFGRLAAANQTSLDALLGILPSWFRIETRWHDDRWQHQQLTARADDAAACLAVVSGSTIAGIKNALPAFGGKRGRAVTACRLCTASRRIRRQPGCSTAWIAGTGVLCHWI
jgi:hypothetical protein